MATGEVAPVNATSPTTAPGFHIHEVFLVRELKLDLTSRKMKVAKDRHWIKGTRGHSDQDKVTTRLSKTHTSCQEFPR